MNTGNKTEYNFKILAFQQVEYRRCLSNKVFHYEEKYQFFCFVFHYIPLFFCRPWPRSTELGITYRKKETFCFFLFIIQTTIISGIFFHRLNHCSFILFLLLLLKIRHKDSTYLFCSIFKARNTYVSSIMSAWLQLKCQATTTTKCQETKV